MKYLFLDFDGVVNRTDTVQQPSLFDRVEPAMVTLLNDIDAQIVISSAWREHNSLADLKQILHYNGLRDPSRIIDTTPVFGGARGDEIQAWMTANDVTASQIVILDDLDDMAHLLPRLVQTDAAHGLQPSHVVRINALLAA